MKKWTALILSAVLLFSLLPLSHAEEAAPSLTLNKTELMLARGKTVKLVPKADHAGSGKLKYEWASSDESVATVKGGVVKGVFVGEAVITCTAALPDGTALSAEAKVTVLVPVKSVKAQQKKITVARGETQQIGWSVTPSDATLPMLSWQSGNEYVATVDADGAVTGVSPGTAAITGVTVDGTNKKLKVTVTVKEGEAPPAENADGGQETGTANTAEPAEDSRLARLSVTYGCGCTGEHVGAMVGPSGMFVTASALCCPDHGKKVKDILFRFGPRADGSAFLEMTDAFTYTSYEDITKTRDYERAVGYIVFSWAVGEKTGWFDCKVASDKEIKARPLLIRTYDENYLFRDIPAESIPDGKKLIRCTADEELKTDCAVFLQKDGQTLFTGITVGAAGGACVVRRLTRTLYSDLKKAGIFKK